MIPTALDQIPVARDVVCFWKQNDLGLYGRRADRWIQYWNQHPDVERVWVIEPPMTKKLFDQWISLSTQADLLSGREFVLLLDQLLRKQAGLADFGKVRYLSFIENGRHAGKGFESWILEHLQSEAVTNPLVVLWPMCFVSNQLLEYLSPAVTVTDIVDDQRQFKGNRHRIAAIQNQYGALMGCSDVVISNSPALINAFEEEFLRTVHYVPNGSLPVLKDVCVSDTLPCLKNIRTDGRKVAGYVGNLRERIDVKRLLSLVKDKTNWDFWFIGQIYGSEFYKAATGLPNCHFFGAMDLTVSRQLMTFFDVALVPFEDNPLTQRMSLLKLEEYAMAGKPVWDFRTLTKQVGEVG